MENKVKVILISHLPLPYHSIGSWTNRYDKYVSNSNTKIDTIICPNPKLKPHSNLEYKYYNTPYLFRIRSKIYNDRFFHIRNTLSKIIKQNSECYFILHIVDNFGLVKSLVSFVKKNNLKKKIYLQYSYHGFILNTDKNLTQKLFHDIDELLLLTNSSYESNLKKFKKLPKQVSISSNCVDTSVFNNENRIFKTDKTVFLWCSQDRHKKGLHVLLSIWDEFHNKYPSSELWIVGTHKEIIGNGIKSLGRIANKNLPDIYTKADVYLFPTLCLEGFGLTLAEALHCGCFCIASNIGGVPDVLNQGKFGWLIDEPEHPKNWFKAMQKYMVEKPKPIKIPKDLYSAVRWNNNMNAIIENAKSRLEKSS